MSKPFMLGIPGKFPRSWILEYDDDRSISRLRLNEGKELPADAAILFRSAARSDDLRKWDVLPNSALVPVVNQRVADLVFVAAPNDVQLLSAGVVDMCGAVVTGFHVVNVLRVVSGIDWSKSEGVRFSDGSLDTFERLSFLPGCLGDAHLALEKEYLSFTLISEELVRKLREERVKGIKFERAEDVHW